MFLDQQKQRQRQSYNAIQNVLKGVYNLQNQPHLQQTIKLNNLYVGQHFKQLTKQIPDPSPITQQQYAIFLRKCQKMMDRNQKIKQNILLIKNKLIKQLALTDTYESASNLEEVQVTQKIKRLTSDIRGKILQIKQKQYLDKQTQIKNQHTDPSNKPSKQKMQPLNLQLEEMKKGTEFMARNLIGLKYDMEVTEKYFKPSSDVTSKAQQQQFKYY